MNRDRSEVWVFEGADVSRGPIARVALPERICVGTQLLGKCVPDGRMEEES